MLSLAGAGLLAAALPTPPAAAEPVIPGAEPVGAVIFADEFDGPPGAPPDYTLWTPALARETIRNPAFWDRPENMGQYRDDRQNLFLDGNSNLVIRATNEGGRFSGAKITGKQRIGIGHTWEARVKLECLTPGCWPAWWLLNDTIGGEIDLLEWFGNGGWGPGSTVHGRLDGTTAVSFPIEVDPEWHTWRCTWDAGGVRFWKDPATSGGVPYFEVRAGALGRWPFSEPGFEMFPVLNLAVGGSGGGDPIMGIYPAQMLVDYVRVW